jgi:S-layer protein
LAASTTTSTAVLDGGNGTDTIKMDLTSENNLEAVAAIQTKIVGFEVLNVTGVTGAAAAIDMSKLGFSSITVEGIAAGAGNLLTLSTFGNGGTLTINADIGAGATGYTISNAAFTAGAADAVNVVLGTAVTAAGTVTAAKVETVNITANDKAAATMTLTAADATTVTVAGAGALTVTPTGSTALTAFDATNSSGGVTYTSLSTKAETITGGSGADVLTAAVGTKAVTIVGGAGNDTITANGGLDTLTGGAGKDTFVITTASANVNSYATIVDAGVGDKIKMTSADSFAAASLSLAETAVFQDYANLAISGSGLNDVTWFQYGGNTYVVENLSTAASFQNGTDFIVKLTGAIDLSTASFSTGSIIQLN